MTKNMVELTNQAGSKHFQFLLCCCKIMEILFDYYATASQQGQIAVC